MKYLLILSITIIITLTVSTIAFTQPTLPSAPNQAPIDGGLGLLAATGGVYAWKKLKDRNKRTEVKSTKAS
tara:strand:+ start:14958 stop:15170 length:213 start_codon:yes stop_codon:yes gene_type:complete